MQTDTRPIPITVTDEVADAVQSGHPVVALESTIVTHGMPWPENLQTAQAVEAAVRDSGAVPATVAVIEGELCAGLSSDVLERLAKADDVMKLSRADLAMAVARGANGSTTVAATMIAAALAGIHVFATGGIGGVHRGAEASFDISADLQELSRTDVTVVCAGAKAILDLPKTLEVLETLGVPVLAYGQDALPAFWSRDSGLAAPLRVDDVDEIVAFRAARQRLAIDGGVLVARPVDSEHEIPRTEMQAHIEQALTDASRAGVRGKRVTPWLLGRIVELTDGRSLATNRELILGNARLAGEIAGGYSRLGGVG